MNVRIVLQRIMLVLGVWCFWVSPAAAYYSDNYCAGLESYSCNWAHNLTSDVKRDFCTYFQPDNLLVLGAFLGAAGVSANTGLDRSIRDHWQNNLRSTNSRRVFKFVNELGDLVYTAPLYAACIGLGYWQDQTFLGNTLYHYGYRSFRTLLLATIQQVPLAPTLGSGRPSRNEPSKWQPFKYRTGVSGHALVGAVPFLTAAFMTEAPGPRVFLFGLSTLTGLARIDNNAHYFSQVLLGWGIALLSANAVYQSDLDRPMPVQLGLQPRSDGFMLAASLKF